MISANHSTKTNQQVLKSKDGYKLYYEKNIINPKSPVLFFLHGVGGDLDAWHFVRENLAKQGFSSIAMDFRGHGYSDHPRKFRSYEIANLVEDVAAIQAQEGIKQIILVGHCYGAITALSFALRYPTKLKKLIIISGSYTRPPYLKWKILQVLTTSISNFLALISPKPYKPKHSEYPVGKFHLDYEWIGLAKTIMHNSLRSYILTSKEIIKLDLQPALKKIKTPTLVIVGEADSIFPVAISRTIHENISTSQLEIVPGANHVVILNNADRVAALIHDFVK